MKFAHEMPFGAWPSGAGVDFRLWAPAATAVQLELHDDAGAALLDMPGDGEGLFHLRVADAAAGSRYRFRIDGALAVADPASRCNPDGVMGCSEVVDPFEFEWRAGWQGRLWREAVIYELHLGAFTPEGTLAAAERKLPALAAAGITAVELMPLAAFAGRRGWGYDGVLLFAPESCYGRPADLKGFVDGAHALGIMVFLDVVYNHFGPEGNFLYAYAPQFFTEQHHTPWGAAVSFDQSHSAMVRQFYIHNALYWLEEYQFDGLRLDAVHAIRDDSPRHILAELSAAVRDGPGRARQIHLVLENDQNQVSWLRRGPGGAADFEAQWSDDFHHACHVLLTGEDDGYYADYAGRAIEHFGRCLAEGLAYQGEPSEFRNGRARGEPSARLPPDAFVSFLQNHDQVGNRACGERLTVLAQPARLRAFIAVQLLAPAIPMLFMGEEFGARTPFLYFCDFEGGLAGKVRDGRRAEFARFARFADPASRERIPDPGAEQTYLSSKLDWRAAETEAGRDWLAFYRELLMLRSCEIAPLLPRLRGDGYRLLGEEALEVRWGHGEGGLLILHANFGAHAVAARRPTGSRVIHVCGIADERQLGPCSVRWLWVPGAEPREGEDLK